MKKIIEWIKENKFWILLLFALLVLIYVFYPAAGASLTDIAKLKEANRELAETVKSQDRIIADLMAQGEDQKVKTEAAEQAAQNQFDQNEDLARENDKLVARYDAAKKAKDTVQVSESCDELRAANVKLSTTLRQTAISTQKAIRELKAQVRIKDELIKEQAAKITLLSASLGQAQQREVLVTAKLNKSEKRRVANARVAKIATFVAGALGAAFLIAK